MKTCHKCGEEWARQGQPGFKETCPKCTSYLHACLNCRLYNPTADRCSSVTAECTEDRAGLNYCEEFQLRDAPNNSNHRAQNGRAARSLGFDGPGGNGDSPEKRPSAARQKFDKLFGE